MSELIEQNNILFSPTYKKLLKSYEDNREEAINTIIKQEVEFNNAIAGVTAEKFNRGIETKEDEEQFFENLKFLETQRQPTYFEVITKIPKSTWLGFKLSGISLARAITDLVDLFDAPLEMNQRLKELGGSEQNYLQKTTEELYKDLGEYAPKNMSTGQWLIYNTSIGVAKMLPFMVTAKLTGATSAVGAGASFFKQLLSLSKVGLAISGVEAVEKYNELITQGVDKKTATATSIMNGVVSYYANKIPMERLLDPTTSKGIKNLFINMLGETAAEVITDIGHFAIDNGMLGKGNTMGDLISKIKDTAILTPLMTATLNSVITRVPNLTDKRALAIDKAKVLAEIYRNNQTIQDMPLLKAPIVSNGIITYGKTFEIGDDGKINIVKTSEQFSNINGFSTETVEAFKTLLKSDPTTIDLVDAIPEKSVEQKIKSFIEQGTFTVGLASDLSDEDINIYSEMGERILRTNELANMDVPKYITLDVVDIARNKKINELIKQGVIDIDNHPAINILDNIEKRLLMKDKDVRRYRKENSLTMEEQINYMNDKSIEVEKLNLKISENLVKINTIENKMKDAEKDQEQIMKLKSLYDEINDSFDTISSIRKGMIERLNKLKNNKKIVIDNKSKVELYNIIEKTQIDPDNIREFENIQKISDDIKITKENIDLSTIKDTNVREYINNIIDSIEETKRIRKQIKETKDESERKVFLDKIDEIKKVAIKDIEEMNKKIYGVFETISLLDKDGALTPEFMSNFKSLTENFFNIYNQIKDNIDTNLITKDMRENIEIDLDKNINKLNKLIANYLIEKEKIIKSISSIPDDITRIKIQANLIKNIPDSMLGVDLQMFGVSNIEQAEKYIESMTKEYGDDKNISENINILKKQILNIKKILENNKYENWNSIHVKQKPEHFTALGRILKEIVQPHHVDSLQFQQYLEGSENIMQIEKSRLKNEIVALYRPFKNLTKAEQTRLLETAMSKSMAEDEFWNYEKFLDYVKDDDILSKNTEKYYQAYEAHKRVFDRILDMQIEALIKNYPDIADIIKKTKKNYYIPQKRKPGNFIVLVKETGKNSNKIWFYNEYITKEQADNAIADIKSGKKLLSTDGRITRVYNSTDFEIIGKVVTAKEKDRNIMRYLLGIFPQKEIFKTRDEWSSFLSLTDNIESSIDQAVYNMNNENFDPNNPSNLDSLSKQIKENLLKMNRKENAIGQLFLHKKGTAGLEAEDLIKNIDEYIIKSINSVSRLELLKFHKDFMENNFKTLPSDIKVMINRFYEANINNPDVYHQLANKMAFMTSTYHLGGSFLSALKNVVTAAPMTLALSGDFGVNPITTAKHILITTPKVTNFIIDYVKNNIKDMLFNSGINSENLDSIRQFSLDAGFSDKETDFFVRMFRDGFITTGITDEFASVFMGALDSPIKKIFNGLMTPFKISEIAVRMMSSITTAKSLIDGGKFKDLSDPDITRATFNLVNRHQPRSGISGRISATQRKGIVGAAARASTSLLSFSFNFGATMYDQAMKGYDVFKTEKGFKKLTKNNYWLGLGAYVGSMMLLGGAKALPFSDDMRRLYRTLFKDEDILTKIQKDDSAIGRMLSGGAFGLMYLDVPGLAIGVPMSVGTGGVTASMYKRIYEGAIDIVDGIEYGNWGKVYRGLEYSAPSIMRRMMTAIREYVYGLSTKEGIKLLDPETGQQRKLSGIEAITKLTGLNAITKNYTDAQIKRFSNEIKRIYDKTKKNIIESARYHINKGNLDKAYSEINAFNDSVYKYYDKHGELPTSPIKSLTTERYE